MSAIYDNWDRLIAAILRREENREAALRSPSDLSSASRSSSSSLNLGSFDGRVSSLISSSLPFGKSFTYSEILQATDSFSDSKLLTRGHSGDLYFGTLQNGDQVVVKKVNASFLAKELCLISELEIFPTVNDSRMVPLLGYCLEKNADEKFLVYGRVYYKDLSIYLSGKLCIDWTNVCSSPLVPGDIQVCSILVDDEFQVRLGSLTGACTEEKYNQNKIPRSSRSSEQKKYGTSNAVRASDVYRSGKVLLELVSGKLGISAAYDSTMKDRMAN